MEPQYRLCREDEHDRYRRHRNNVHDPAYQRFVEPLVDEVIESFSEKDRGLDLGCGNGPVISYLLKTRGFDIDMYDPCFHDDTSVLSRRYDYIILSEVIEHFHQPGKEFERLFSMLIPDGKLFCFTELFSDRVDFARWHYKEDETHVFFYDERTIRHIANNLHDHSYHIDGRLIVFSS